MSEFKKYLHEEKIIEAITSDDDDAAAASNRKAILTLITSYFQRFINTSDPGDTKSMLYLIAALNVLNTGEDDAYAVSTAKRLAQLAFVKSGRMKKGK